jgi:hypothetical protein
MYRIYYRVRRSVFRFLDTYSVSTAVLTFDVTLKSLEHDIFIQKLLTMFKYEKRKKKSNNLNLYYST